MKTPWTLGLLLATFCSAGWAQPAPPEPGKPLPGTPATPPENVGKPIGPPDAGFDQLDGNRDGRLSRTEAKASTELTARFAEFDADGNGHLSRSEYEAFGREPADAAAPAPRPR